MPIATKNGFSSFIFLVQFLLFQNLTFFYPAHLSEASLNNYLFGDLKSHNHAFTIAVLDFQNHSFLFKNELQGLQQGLADMMITTLSQVQELKVVERRQLKTLLEEMALGQSGSIDTGTAQQVGKLLGARYMVVGSFIQGYKNELRIDVRIVKTETGEIIKAEEVTGKLDEVLYLIRKLSEKVFRKLQIKLNDAEKREMANSLPDCSPEVIMNYFRALYLIDAKDLQSAKKLLDKAFQQCPGFHRAAIAREQLQKALKNKK
ncbi:hypothetical protein B1H10_03860 [candidate division KSB1 bacterium 4484_188]|nr:MAG: hypothetical protein B1H10_03860 [candidate division KSB1 bacterium 4484_188]